MILPIGQAPLQQGLFAGTTSFPTAPPAPYVFAGNGRITVMLAPRQGIQGFIVRTSTGKVLEVNDPNALSVVFLGLLNGVAVTAQVAYKYGPTSTAFSPMSRSVTPTAISGFADVGIDPIHFYHPDLLGLGNGASVATLPDLSGNGYDAVQATGGNQPTFATNFANGRSAVRGSGGRWLTFPSALVYHGGAFTDISVWALATAAPSDSRYYSNQASTTDSYFVSADANGTAAQAQPRFRLQLPAQSPYTLPDIGTNVSLLSVRLSADIPGRAYLNGAVQSTPTAPGVAWADRRSWQIFGYGGNNKTLNGYCLHFSRWPAAMTQLQRWQVENWLAAQFAITTTQN